MKFYSFAPELSTDSPVRRADLTMTLAARSNTALFQSPTWRPSEPISPPKPGARGVTVSLCEAARAAVGRCCVRGAPKAASESACKFGLGPRRRLTGRGTFERLLREGERRGVSGYTFYVARRSEGPPRLGILISRKHAAKATERNYLKRCVREAFRLEQARIGSCDLLVRPPYGARPGAAMIARLRELLAGLGR